MRNQFKKSNVFKNFQREQNIEMAENLEFKKVEGELSKAKTSLADLKKKYGSLESLLQQQTQNVQELKSAMDFVQSTPQPAITAAGHPQPTGAVAKPVKPETKVKKATPKPTTP